MASAIAVVQNVGSCERAKVSTDLPRSAVLIASGKKISTHLAMYRPAGFFAMKLMLCRYARLGFKAFMTFTHADFKTRGLLAQERFEINLAITRGPRFLVIQPFAEQFGISHAMFHGHV